MYDCDIYSKSKKLEDIISNNFEKIKKVFHDLIFKFILILWLPFKYIESIF